MAEEQSILVYRGEYHQATISVVAATPDGDPVDLTGARMSLGVWASLDSTQPLFAQKTSDPSGGIEIGDQGTNPGQAVVTIEAADTASLARQKAFFVLWVVDVAGKPRVAIPPSTFEIREAKAPPA